MISMDVKEYMQRRCYHCGAPRSEHAHFRSNTPGIPGGELQVIAVSRPKCKGFLDEIEHELGGDPLRNSHLAPLMREHRIPWPRL